MSGSSSPRGRRASVAALAVLLVVLARTAIASTPTDLSPERWATRQAIAELSRQTWPTVDSLRVDAPYYRLGQDTTVVSASLTNPHPNHTFVFPVQLLVSHALSGYRYVSPLQEVSLAPGDTVAVQLSWYDPDAAGYLAYDVQVRMVFEDATRENLLTNGDFEAGLTGWEVVNDNPPGYGVEHTTFEDGDPDGEAHVYSTQYNTWGIQPQISQTATGVSSGHVVHLSFAMNTEDMIYGTGVGLVIVQRGSGQTVFWHSTAATPPDDSNHHYIRVLDTARHDRALTVDQIPGGTGDAVAVGAAAALIAPSGYGMAETDVYLDDTGIREADFLETTTGAAFVMTTLDTQTIGDYRVALQECAEFSSWPEGAESLDLLPLMGNLFTFDKIHRSVCAAAVYQDTGDELLKYASLGMAGYHALEMPLTVLGGGGASTVPVGGVAVGAIADVLDLAATGLEGAILEQTPDLATWGGAAAGLLGGESRLTVLVLGALETEVTQGGAGRDAAASVSADSLGLIDAWVQRAVPGELAFGYLGPRARPLDADAPPAGTTPRTLFLTATAADTVGFAMTNSLVDGTTESVTLADLDVATGDRLWLTVSDTTTQYACSIDRGGDGTVDQTLILTPTTVTAAEPSRLPAAPRLMAAPNPFNPRTELRFRLASAGPVSCQVFDLTGRRVATLVSHELPAGPHTVVWSGQDDRGRALSSGIYLARLRTEKGVATRKLTLVR